MPVSEPTWSWARPFITLSRNRPGSVCLSLLLTDGFAEAVLGQHDSQEGLSGEDEIADLFLVEWSSEEPQCSIFTGSVSHGLFLVGGSFPQQAGVQLRSSGFFVFLFKDLFLFAKERERENLLSAGSLSKW